MGCVRMHDNLDSAACVAKPLGHAPRVIGKDLETLVDVGLGWAPWAIFGIAMGTWGTAAGLKGAR